MTSLHIYTGRASSVKPKEWAEALSNLICPECGVSSLITWISPEMMGTNYRCQLCHRDYDWPPQWRDVEEITCKQSTPEATERLYKVLEYEHRCGMYEECGRDERGRFMAWPEWPFEEEKVKVI